MNKTKKIITSALLAAVMSLSLSLGVVAQEVDPEMSEDVGAVSEISAPNIPVLSDDELTLTSEDGSVTRFERDADGYIIVNMNGVETRLTDEEFSEWKSSFENRIYYVQKTQDTSGGTNGFLRIEYGIYKVSRSPVTHITQYFYGVYAKIIDAKNITTDISIDATFYTPSSHQNITKSVNTDKLEIEVLADGYISVSSKISVPTTTAFGSFKTLEVNASFGSSATFTLPDDAEFSPAAENSDICAAVTLDGTEFYLTEEQFSELRTLVAEDFDVELVQHSEDGSVNVLERDAEGCVTIILNGVETRLTGEEYFDLKVVGIEVRRSGMDTTALRRAE